MKKIFIIAEAGVNHNGDIGIARRLIDEAVSAGADAVKFQTFTAEENISKFAPKADYQKALTGGQSQLEMLKELELSKEAHSVLLDYCKGRKILFLSTPKNIADVDLLDSLGMEIFKISSADITHLNLLRRAGRLKKKVILSTGMSELVEIETALKVLTDLGTKREDITILHCNTEYPTPMEDVNLRAMLAIRDMFKMSVGYSDHTLGIEVPVAAAALGAEIIEKHLTLDKNMKGPDHSASLEPLEFKRMVSAIRNIEIALGDGVKRVSFSEEKNKTVVRKSIVAAKDIKAGELFSEENLAVKRPFIGISPMEWDSILGRRAKKDFTQDEVIQL